MRPTRHIPLRWGQPSDGFLALPSFFEQPILNSPYESPRRHWELDWEMELCRLLESHPNVLAYVANQGLGFAVPYRMGGEARTYIPDFIVRVDDGHGADDPLNLVVEVRGYRREDAKAKKQTMENYWVPAVNQLGDHGRWAFRGAEGCVHDARGCGRGGGGRGHGGAGAAAVRAGRRRLVGEGGEQRSERQGHAAPSERIGRVILPR